MKIWVDSKGTAPSPRRVRIYLAEKGIEVPYGRLEIHVENRTPEFQRKNPLSTLPVLELDDGTCISESISICRYFEELHPDPPLFGSTPREKAQVDMWMRRVEFYVYLAIDLTGAYQQRGLDETAALARKRAERSLAFFDGVLADSEFIAGRRYTIADVVALSALDFGIAYNDFAIAPEHENLARWHRAVSSRPSAGA